MPDETLFPLRVVDACDLDERYKNVLRPGGTMRDATGHARELPRYFYEVPSWEVAMQTRLSPNFHLWEFIQIDVREAEPVRLFPRYVPCAITLLAVCLERLREAVGTYVHVAANGGYRSPTHRLTHQASPHCWGTAANIYRIGDTYLDSEKTIERYRNVARGALPGVWTRPFGHPLGFAQDHLHLDIGYVLSVPRDIG